MSYVDSAIPTSINQNFVMTERSLNTIGMTMEARCAIYRLLAAILNIGNIKIDETGKNGDLCVSDGSKKYLDNVAVLLNQESSELTNSLLTRVINVAGTKIQ